MEFPGHVTMKKGPRFRVQGSRRKDEEKRVLESQKYL
jgi:hypothetical protein